MGQQPDHLGHLGLLGLPGPLASFASLAMAGLPGLPSPLDGLLWDLVSDLKTGQWLNMRAGHMNTFIVICTVKCMSMPSYRQSKKQTRHQNIFIVDFTVKFLSMPSQGISGNKQDT
jgi:hypothetical protein